ncbi:MAG: hypothetical protein PHR06_02365 [Candidatus Cloacimonetes bacterium]|nr:hypothetical protein [Candidatus Cloacimonadota bacterium]
MLKIVVNISDIKKQRKRVCYLSPRLIHRHNSSKTTEIYTYQPTQTIGCSIVENAGKQPGIRLSII